MVEPLDKIKAMLEPNEKLLKTISQQSGAVRKAKTVAITDKRFIIYEPKLFGAHYVHHEWLDVERVDFLEGATRSCIVFSLVGGGELMIGGLSKQKAPKFFSVAQEQQRIGYLERRRRTLEEDRAISGGADISVGTQPQTEGANIGKKIKQLKSLLEEGLITEEEFQQKKRKLLDQLEEDRAISGGADISVGTQPRAEGTIAQKIQELTLLLDARFITEDEFQQKKRKLLDQLTEDHAMSGGADISVGTQLQREGSVGQKIKELRLLLDAHLITEEEFQQRKQKLLDQL